MIVGITGVAGRIGSRLARAVSSVAEVRGFDSRTPAPDLINHLTVWTVADLSDHSALAKFAHGCDAVVHLAGRLGGVPSMRAPREYHRVNVNGTLALLAGCESGGVRQFIFSSTQCVFGATQSGPFFETTVPRPSSVYGVTKYLAETYVLAESRRTGIESTVVRLPRLHDPSESNLINRVTRAVRAGEALDLHGHHDYRFDYLHVDDAVTFLLATLGDNRLRGLFHLAGHAVSFLDIVRAALVAGDRDSVSLSYRRAGATDEMMEADLTPRCMVFGRPTRAERLGYAEVRPVLEGAGARSVAPATGTV
jgi:UDP-glucose 4-epimerase